MKKHKLIALSCLIGASLEWYDFALFGLLMPTLSRNFFPQDDLGSLTKTILVFSSAFFVRPLGALFWSYFAHKRGRKGVLLYSVSLMTISTVTIGLLPGYQTLGIYSISLLLLLRLMQGFSASGEHAATLTYLHEIAPNSSKGLYSSIGIIGVYLGIALAVLIYLLLMLLPESQNIISWRLAFIASFALGIVAYQLRKHLASSLEPFQQTDVPRTKNNFLNTKVHIKKILCGIGVFQLAVVVPYITYYYVVSITVQKAIFSGFYLYGIIFINALLTAILIPVFAKFYEKSDSTRLIQFSLFGTLIGAIPVYAMFFVHNYLYYAVAQTYFSILTAMLVGPFCLLYAKQFPSTVRFTAIALCFNFSASYFGGLSPLIMSFIQQSNSPILFSGLFIVCSCIVALIALPSLVKEGSQGIRKTHGQLVQTTLPYHPRL